MAETSPSAPPSLPSTADEVPYAPVSWLAVGAVGVAGLFVFLLVILGYDAYRGKKPLLMPELLILAGLAVVLSFAARRVIRVAEGTRTGVKLTDYAWWGAVVGGILYSAYWFAIEYSIRRDARDEVQKWVATVCRGEFSQAFHRTLEPGRRTKLRPDDEAKMTAEFRDPMTAFRQLDLSRIAMRNLNECEFVPGGLRDWVQKPNSIDCVFTGTVRCPEGVFPVHIPLKGSEGLSVDGVPVGRQWQIIPSQNGYVQLEKSGLTQFGWFMIDLDRQGGTMGRQFINLAGNGAPAVAYHAFARQPATVETLKAMADRTRAEYFALGGLAAAVPYSGDYSSFVTKNLFRLPGGEDPSPDQTKRFLDIWQTYGVAPSGSRLKNSVDIHTAVSVVRGPDGKAAKIEVRVPIELPLPGQEADMAAARGRLIVECTDPEALARWNLLRENSANPNLTTASTPDDFGKTTYAWRVVRIESDLYRITGRPPDGPPGSNRPGMGGAH